MPQRVVDLGPLHDNLLANGSRLRQRKSACHLQSGAVEQADIVPLGENLRGTFANAKLIVFW